MDKIDNNPNLSEEQKNAALHQLAYDIENLSPQLRQAALNEMNHVMTVDQMAASTLALLGSSTALFGFMGFSGNGTGQTPTNINSNGSVVARRPEEGDGEVEVTPTRLPNQTGEADENTGGDKTKNTPSADQKPPKERIIIHDHDYNEGSLVGNGTLNIREGVSNPLGDPTRTNITLSAAWGREGYPRGADHNGADFTGPTGTKVNAAIEGVIIGRTQGLSMVDGNGKVRGVFIDKNGTYTTYDSKRKERTLEKDEIASLQGKPAAAWGNSVTLRSTIGGQAYDVTYAHLRDSVDLPKGMTIKSGQSFGVMGSTGYSTGEHLHMMVTTSVEPVGIPKDYVRIKDGKYQIDPVYFLNHVYNKP